MGHNFKNLYFALAPEPQVRQLKAAAETLILPKIIIAKSQLRGFVETPTPGYYLLPLTPLQYKKMINAKINELDFIYEMSYHQFKIICKDAFDIDINIDDLIINHFAKKRLFRKKNN